MHRFIPGLKFRHRLTTIGVFALGCSLMAYITIVCFIRRDVVFTPDQMYEILRMYSSFQLIFGIVGLFGGWALTTMPKNVGERSSFFRTRKKDAFEMEGYHAPSGWGSPSDSTLVTAHMGHYIFLERDSGRFWVAPENRGPRIHMGNLEAAKAVASYLNDAFESEEMTLIGENLIATEGAIATLKDGVWGVYVAPYYVNAYIFHTRSQAVTFMTVIR